MVHLIKHLIDNHFEEILEKSILNCHVVGLHSIMLLDSPEKRIRMYVTTPNHELYLNSVEEPQTLAYHTHHCNLTLVSLRGIVTNIIARESDNGKGALFLSRYRYTSQINTGKNKFELLEKNATLFHEREDVLMHGNSVKMTSKDIHTVFVPQGAIAAWLVLEGKEDKNYHSECWSSTDLISFNANDLYLKPSISQLIELLIVSDVLNEE